MPEQPHDSDVRLRDRLASAEARVGVSTSAPDLDDAPGRSRWIRPVLVTGTALAAVVVAVVVIGQLPDRSGADASIFPSPSPIGPVTAAARDGDFVLTLSSPQSAWTTEDAIEVSAILSYDGDEPEVTIGGACGPILFDLRQLSGGDAVMGGAQCEPYLSYSLGPETPLVRPFEKSGELRDEPPFDRAFFEDPELRLPPGRWQISAVLDFDYPQGSERGFRTLQVAIEIDVVEAVALPKPTALPSEPTATATPPLPVCMRAVATGVLGVDADGNPVLTIEGWPAPVSIVFSYPDDFVIEPTPVLTIYDRDGDVLAREGDEVELGGGFNAEGTVFSACGIDRHRTRATIECELSSEECDAALAAFGELFYLADRSLATVGDTLTVRGTRSRELGSFCMVGIVHEASEVLVH